MVDEDTENTDFGSQTSFQTDESIELLNKFMFFHGKKPLPKPENKWSLYSERSRRRYCQLFKELFTEVISSFFPDEEADVLTYMWQSTEERDLTETDIVSALIASYKNTSVWQIKRQILSVLTVSLNLKNIQKHIPGLTEYRYYIAQKHSILYGCAMPPPERENIRQKMDPLKLSSFLDFITSSHIIKDLPFGEKRLKLSSGEVMDVPNIIRCMGPAAIIQQYKVYCEEKNIECLGKYF